MSSANAATSHSSATASSPSLPLRYPRGCSGRNRDREIGDWRLEIRDLRIGSSYLESRISSLESRISYLVWLVGPTIWPARQSMRPWKCSMVGVMDEPIIKVRDVVFPRFQAPDLDHMEEF